MRIVTALIFLLFASIIFLSGCASTPQTGHPSNMAWYQAGISAEQTKRDLADCQNESLAYGKSSVFAGETGAGGVIFDYMAENQRQNNIVQSCMIAKGYSLVKTNSPLLTDGQQTLPEQDSVINAKLLGHWIFIPSPEMPLRGQYDIYFLPQNRYKSSSSVKYTNGLPLEQTPSEDGRYYFVGNKLVQWADTEEKPEPPIAFSVSDTQLTFQVGQWQFLFIKQAQ